MSAPNVLPFQRPAAHPAQVRDAIKPRRASACRKAHEGTRRAMRQQAESPRWVEDATKPGQPHGCDAAYRWVDGVVRARGTADEVMALPNDVRAYALERLDAVRRPLGQAYAALARAMAQAEVLYAEAVADGTVDPAEGDGLAVALERVRDLVDESILGARRGPTGPTGGQAA